jgi:hypothetical protein
MRGYSQRRGEGGEIYVVMLNHPQVYHQHNKSKLSFIYTEITGLLQAWEL